MVRMIPPYPREGANFSERSIFMALEGIQDRPDWIAIHSLAVGQHLTGLSGEADFVVLVPGAGILVIEAKAPKYVEYKAGDWYLDRTPQPNKDPLKQLDGTRRSIRGFLRRQGLSDGDEPISRLLWFTSLGRHQFENRTPGDLQFFEWELGWQEDLKKPARLIEKVLSEHYSWFAEVDAVDIAPEALTHERADAIAAALVGDFVARQTPEEQKAERRSHEARLLGAQKFALELIETNDHVYFDGPAGTGKSNLLAESARRLAAEGKRTLVTCWNVLMAEELQRLVGSRSPSVEVADLNAVMLSVCGLPANPPDAASDWYTVELPTRALERLTEKPYLGGYEAICVDEFQDVAGAPLLLDVLFALAGTGSAAGTGMILAGDDRQQILRRRGERVTAYGVARERIPDVVNVQVRRNCRSVPQLTSAAEEILGHKLGFTGHRFGRSVPGGFETVGASEGSETRALTTALKSMLQHHEPHDIVILSPFGDRNSLVGKFLARAEKSQDERWLRKQLQHEGSTGSIRWRSIFKFKGLEADAVILTDFGESAQEFVASNDLDWDDLRYVGLTRAKYRCAVIEYE